MFNVNEAKIMNCKTDYIGGFHPLLSNIIEVHSPILSSDNLDIIQKMTLKFKEVAKKCPIYSEVYGSYIR